MHGVWWCVCGMCVSVCVCVWGIGAVHKLHHAKGGGGGGGGGGLGWRDVTF